MVKMYAGRIFLSGLIIFLVFSGCSASLQNDEIYHLSYNGNGNDRGKPPAAVQGLSGATVMMAVNSGYLTKNGYYFAGWNTLPDGSGRYYRPGEIVSIPQANMELYAWWLPGTPDKIFHAAATDNTWYPVDAEILAENDRCIVYGDMKENISRETAERIAQEYEEIIYTKIISAFGDIHYMFDNKNKLFLLLTDIIDGYSGGGYVAGYFDSTHMLFGAKSNSAAMLFLDVNPGRPSEITEFCTVIAHELQHLINFSHPGRAPQNIWINEGLSLAAEYIYGGEQSTRIGYFNGTYGNTTIPYGNNFFVWDGYWERQYGDVLANYATAYLFFRWLGIQADNSTIYRDIVASQYMDYRAVTDAASKIDRAFSVWETLLGTWMLANYYRETNGPYGYKQNITSLKVYSLPVGGSKYPLFPGEGVYTEISPESVMPSHPDGNIHYITLPDALPGGLSDIVLANGGIGDALLTFNANTDEGGRSENGYVASRSQSEGETGRNAVNRNQIGPIGVPPGNYPVSFTDMAEKNLRKPPEPDR